MSTVLAQRDISIRQEFISTLIVLLFIAKITTVSQTVKHTEWEGWLLFQALLRFPVWKPLLSFTSDLMLMPDTFLFLTGRSPHMWQWTAGFVIRTQWCRMGIATAGTAPTASSTTASRRYSDELPAGWLGRCSWLSIQQIDSCWLCAEHLQSAAQYTCSHLREHLRARGCADMEWWWQGLCLLKQGKKVCHFHQYLWRFLFFYKYGMIILLYFGIDELCHIGCQITRPFLNQKPTTAHIGCIEQWMRRRSEVFLSLFHFYFCYLVMEYRAWRILLSAREHLALFYTISLLFFLLVSSWFFSEWRLQQAHPRSVHGTP